MTPEEQNEFNRLRLRKEVAVVNCTALRAERNRLTRALADAETASATAQNEFEEYRRRLIREGAIEVPHERPACLGVAPEGVRR